MDGQGQWPSISLLHLNRTIQAFGCGLKCFVHVLPASLRAIVLVVGAVIVEDVQGKVSGPSCGVGFEINV